MRKQVLGAIALTAALATAPVTIGRAATGSGPGTETNNIGKVELGAGFAVDENGTPAQANSSAIFTLVAGKLTLDQVPNYDFGQANISDIIAGPVKVNDHGGKVAAKLTTYDGSNDAGLINVTDYRGNNAGWTLTAKAGNFQRSNGSDTLTINSLTVDASAQLTTDSKMQQNFPSESIAGTETTTISAAAGHGAGSNSYNTNAALELAQNTKAVAGDYEAVINWTLGSTPTPAAPTQP